MNTISTIFIAVALALAMCDAHSQAAQTGRRIVCPHFDPAEASPFTVAFVLDERPEGVIVMSGNGDNIEAPQLDADEWKPLTIAVSTKAPFRGTHVTMTKRIWYKLAINRVNCDMLENSIRVRSEILEGDWERFANMSYSAVIRSLSFFHSITPKYGREWYPTGCSDEVTRVRDDVKLYQENSRSIDILCGEARLSFRQQRQTDFDDGKCLNAVNSLRAEIYCGDVWHLFDRITEHLDSSMGAL